MGRWNDITGPFRRQLRCYVAEHETEWDSHLFLPTTAYNTQVHASIAEIFFAFLSHKRLHIIGMELMPRLRQDEERSDDDCTAAEQSVEDLRALIPEVRRQLSKAPATNKRALDARKR